jgi:hypothetical protein
MNHVPVPDHGKNEQDQGNQQQPGRFRGVHGVPLFMSRIFPRL